MQIVFHMLHEEASRVPYLEDRAWIQAPLNVWNGTKSYLSNKSLRQAKCLVNKERTGMFNSVGYL
jgi:hypothetical protein